MPRELFVARAYHLPRAHVTALLEADPTEARKRLSQVLSSRR